MEAGEGSVVTPPGELEADEEADGTGAVAMGVVRNLGDSLLLVDSERCSGREARRCLGLRAVVTWSSAIALGNGGKEYVSCWTRWPLSNAALHVGGGGKYGLGEY